MIPLSLYITVELVKLGQIYFITNDLDLYDETSDKRILCRALNINEDLGQVEYVFSDKTGTLTENRMVFKCCTIGGVDYATRQTGITTFFFVFSLVQLGRHVRVLCHSPQSSPVSSISLLQTALVHVILLSLSFHIHCQLVCAILV